MKLNRATAGFLLVERRRCVGHASAMRRRWVGDVSAIGHFQFREENYF